MQGKSLDTRAVPTGDLRKDARVDPLPGRFGSIRQIPYGALPSRSLFAQGAIRGSVWCSLRAENGQMEVFTHARGIARPAQALFRRGVFGVKIYHTVWISQTSREG